MRLNNIAIPVSDLSSAKALYSTLLGAEPYVDEPYYVGFKTDSVEVGLDPSGHRAGHTGPVAYWAVEDLRSALEGLVAAGAEVLAEPRDVGGGRLVASVRDSDGNPFGLIEG